MEPSSSNTPHSAPAAFDPYQEWLGLRAGHPPNHYQLLGLAEFFDGAEEIASAFEDRFQKIRRYEVGARSEDALIVLQHLSAAYAVLSDPQQKGEYDEQLRAETDRDIDLAGLAETHGIEFASEVSKAGEVPEGPRERIVTPPPAPPFPPPFIPQVAPREDGGKGELLIENDLPTTKRAELARHLYVGFLSIISALIVPFVFAAVGVLAAVALLGVGIRRLSIVLWTVIRATVQSGSVFGFRLSITLSRLIDRVLLALVGDEHRIIHNCLRALCMVGALILLGWGVYAGWTVISG